MLKYGDVSLINNGNSKSLVPRNLTYRQKESFKSDFGESDILNIINSNTIENIYSNHIYTTDITAIYANLNVINSTILYIDLISKKTSLDNPIIINNKLQITDQDGSFNYLLSNNSKFKANSLNINIPEIEIVGYITFLNNNIKIYQPLDLSPNGIIKFGSNLQINTGAFNVITISSSTIDTLANITLLNATPNIKFTTGNELIIKDISNYIGFINNNIKVYQPLDLSANGIIKFGSNLQINNGSFNVITINSSNIDTSANITLLNDIPNINFTTGNELIIKDISNYIGFINNNIKVYQPLDLSANGIIKFGSNLQINNGSSNVITINSSNIDTSANITLLNATPNIKFTTGNELIIKDTNNYIGFINNNIKVYQPLDLSANGIIKFGSNLQINNGSSNVITISSSTIDTLANITLLNATPNIKFTTGNELIIKDTNNYITFLNNNIKIYQPLDLSPNGIIKFGSNLQINNGAFNVITISSSTIDTLANITLLNATPNIKFTTGNELIIKDISNYIGFINNNIKVYQPLDLSANGIIKFGSNLQINNGSSNVITINSSNIDTLANITLLNATPNIKFTTGNELIIKDTNNYITFLNNNIKIYQPLDLSPNGIIKFGSNLQINNGAFNVITISSSTIDTLANITLLNATPNIKFTTGNELIIKDISNYIGFINNNIKVYQPLDLSANGIIKFGSNLQINNGSSNVITINSSNIDTSANITLLNDIPNINFTTGNELIIKDISNYIGFINNNIKIYQPLDLSANGIIKFGSNLQINNGSSNVITINSSNIDTSANITLLNDTPNIKFTTGNELIIKDISNYIGFINNNIKVYQPLDLSANGIIKFGSNLQINNGSSNVITINSSNIDTSANITLLNSTPNIKFTTGNELIIKDISNYIGFINNNIKVYQPLDLSANGIIKFGSNLQINNGSSNVITINSSNIDTSANITLLNDTPNIKFTTGNELIIKDISNYLGFLNNNIKVYQPLDLSANGIIKFGSNLQINNGSSNVITINSSNIDTSANITLLNTTPNINFTTGNELIIKDISNYLGFINNNIKVYQPLDLSANGIIKFGSNLQINNGAFNVITISSSTIDISANITLLNSTPNIKFTTGNELIIKDISNYIGFINNNIKVYQPLDLSANGIIKFGSNLQINNGSSNVITINSSNIDTSANITLLNTTPNINFTTGNELIIKDISNYLGFINNNIKVYQPLDLSANGIIKFGSNLQINNGSSNVITINSSNIDTSANITLLNTTPNINFTTGNELIIKDISNYLGFINNNIKVYQPLDLSANGIIKFGSNLQINNGSSNVITINSSNIDTSANITLLNDTPNIKFTTGNELIIKDISNYLGFLNNNIKVYQPLDLSPNGIIKFGSSNVITIKGTTIDISANITLLNTTPNINFTTGNELIIKDISNYLGFINNNIKVYQPLDLSANGIIKFGSNLQINNGSSNVITINSSNIDTSANITLLNDTPNIKFTTGNELIIKDISNYLGFLNNNIKVYQPLDLSPNGIIKFGSSNVITIKGTTIDISANITLLNDIPNINFTTGNELIIKDISNYLGFINNNIKVYQPLDLSANGIIKFGSNLQINNGSSNVITISSTNIDTLANITLLNTTPNINFTTGNELIIKDNSNYLGFLNNNIKVYQPLDLSANGIIKFGSNLQINNGSSNVITIKGTTIDTSANITLLNTTPNINFTTGNELIIKDTSNYIGFLNNNIKIYQPLDLSPNGIINFTTGNELIIKDISNYIGFINNNIKIYQPLDLSPNGIIKFGSNLQINNGSSNVITIKGTTIDTSANITLLNTTPNIKFTTGNELIIKDISNYIGFINNNIKIYQPLDLSPNGIIKFGSSNVMTINSTIIDISANITLLNTTPNINFTTGNELIIKDISNYIGFINNNIKIYQPLDLSPNGIIKFGSNLQIKDSSFNVITIGRNNIDTSANITFLNNIPEIKFNDSLKLYNSTYSDNSSNPILIYNTSLNDYEKKYLKKVTIGITDISMNVYFCNIINSPTNILTFTGKVISISNTNSSHIIFQGYSRILNGINTVSFTTNILFSSDPTNWTIKTMRLENTNLVMEISDNSNTTLSNWIISLESISISFDSATPNITIPNAPTIGTTIAGDSQATVNWMEPANNGGSEIISYTITSNNANIQPKTVNSDILTTNITGLTNGISYTFTVVATNIIGNSLPSASSNSVIIGPITDGPTLAATVTGLTNGICYTFTVVAITDAGDSYTSSSSNSVTPNT